MPGCSLLHHTAELLQDHAHCSINARPVLISIDQKGKHCWQPQEHEMLQSSVHASISTFLEADAGNDQ